jgi:hypothetical protein
VLDVAACYRLAGHAPDPVPIVLEVVG